ncbi:hypothetical protein WA026_020900 [Henosepilachna vigintioctopunctata]|uniref:PiggyBac transposable element-derived protein domain-containing protein n=1 Tax=Henosepilachna vigintioctopunctata TaxID=420089 RepID=A0AAW1UPB5_9CUCU
MNQKRPIRQWFADLSDDEQDIAGSASEDEIVDKTAVVSTHDSESEIEESNAQKPEIVTYYNSTKGGVDCNDQLCSNYNVARRTKKMAFSSIFASGKYIRHQCICHTQGE